MGNIFSPYEEEDWKRLSPSKLIEERNYGYKMEQRLANTWRMTVNVKKFIETALLSDLRIDGHGPFDYRNVTIQFGSEDGSSELQLDQTCVVGFVTSQLVQPYRDCPNEGTLAIFIEFSPMADPLFEVGRLGNLPWSWDA